MAEVSDRRVNIASKINEQSTPNLSMATCKRSAEINCPIPVADNAIPDANPRFLNQNVQGVQKILAD